MRKEFQLCSRNCETFLRSDHQKHSVFSSLRKYRQFLLRRPHSCWEFHKCLQGEEKNSNIKTFCTHCSSSQSISNREIISWLNIEPTSDWFTLLISPFFRWLHRIVLKWFQQVCCEFLHTCFLQFFALTLRLLFEKKTWSLTCLMWLSASISNNTPAIWMQIPKVPGVSSIGNFELKTNLISLLGSPSPATIRTKIRWLVKIWLC